MTEHLQRLRKRHLAELLALSLGISGSAYAGTPPLYVTSCLDDGSPGTLRSVIAQAGGEAVIDTYSMSNCSTITLTQGEIALQPDAIELAGFNGAPNIVAAPRSRVFSQSIANIFNYPPTLTINGLTISGGRVYTTTDVALGGCISGSRVNLIDSTVSDCIAASAGTATSGGAVWGVYVGLVRSRVENSSAYAAGRDRIARGGGVYGLSVACTDSTITGNHVAAEGGGKGGGVFGVYAVDMQSCTIDHNSADRGGGVAQFYGNFPSSIRDSTISSNTATTAVGGLLFISPLSIYNSTVAFNQSSGACGGLLSVAPVMSQSTIFADNRSATPDCVDFYTRQPSGANNLITVTGASPVPPGTISADPQLTPLADHGGLTFTHGLSQSSPAIDRGSNLLPLPWDQRSSGFHRVVGSYSDIGAFERQADDEELFYGGFE